ncbi:MAG: hypothetical protein D6798_08905 [Deltaproteobacteria bacterium]|nr:MAG: hypothetical protein D6798_08905 [Deltaproteobacteria bacterium]
MIPLLPFLLLPARAERLDLELLRPDGQSFAVHTLEPPRDGEQLVIPDGDQAWSATIRRNAYEGRLQVCADVRRWVSDGHQVDVVTACVVLDGRETPQGSVYVKSDEVHVRLNLQR